jgi:hypothetical protein
MTNTHVHGPLWSEQITLAYHHHILSAQTLDGKIGLVAIWKWKVSLRGFGENAPGNGCKQPTWKL